MGDRAMAKTHLDVASRWVAAVLHAASVGFFAGQSHHPVRVCAAVWSATLLHGKTSDSFTLKALAGRVGMHGPDVARVLTVGDAAGLWEYTPGRRAEFGRKFTLGRVVLAQPEVPAWLPAPSCPPWQRGAVAVAARTMIRLAGTTDVDCKASWELFLAAVGAILADGHGSRLEVRRTSTELLVLSGRAEWVAGARTAKERNRLKRSYSLGKVGLAELLAPSSDWVVPARAGAGTPSVLRVKPDVITAAKHTLAGEADLAAQALRRLTRSPVAAPAASHDVGDDQQRLFDPGPADAAPVGAVAGSRSVADGGARQRTLPLFIGPTEPGQDVQCAAAHVDGAGWRPAVLGDSDVDRVYRKVSAYWDRESVDVGIRLRVARGPRQVQDNPGGLGADIERARDAGLSVGQIVGLLTGQHRDALASVDSPSAYAKSVLARHTRQAAGVRRHRDGTGA